MFSLKSFPLLKSDLLKAFHFCKNILTSKCNLFFNCYFIGFKGLLHNIIHTKLETSNKKIKYNEEILNNKEEQSFFLFSFIFFIFIL